MSTNASPVRLTGHLDTQPSRGLWLVKWLLLIPHLIVLSFLWLAFTVLSVIAFFAILFTGRYPRPIFDFNLGVLRWTWRVWFYGYGALGTDRYPPFSLGEEPDYPATLDIAYPQRLSRGLVLVKWLLAIPHLVVVAFFTGGAGFFLWRLGGGLVTLLALFAGVALLFTGRYPRGIFDLVLGMDRWVARVGAYVGLMTDAYPPFQLDGGEAEPGSAPDEPAEQRTPERVPPGWTGGRVVGVVVGALLLVTGLGTGAGGGTLLWFDLTQRDSAGYVSTEPARFTADGYALRLDAGWPVDWLGDVRIRATGSDSPLFLGIARTDDVDRYLTGVPYGRFDRRAGVPGAMRTMPMMTGVRRPPADPAGYGIWVASTSGTGPLGLTWTAQPGNWSLVVLNADATTGVSTQLDFGATAPRLRPAAIAVLGAGLFLLAIGAVLVAVAVRRPPVKETDHARP